VLRLRLPFGTPPARRPPPSPSSVCVRCLSAAHIKDLEGSLAQTPIHTYLLSLRACQTPFYFRSVARAMAHLLDVERDQSEENVIRQKAHRKRLRWGCVPSELIANVEAVIQRCSPPAMTTAIKKCWPTAMATAQSTTAVASVIAPANPSVPPARVRDTFIKWDTNQDGFLSLEELQAGFHSEFGQLAPHVTEGISTLFAAHATDTGQGMGLKKGIFSRFYAEILCASNPIWHALAIDPLTIWLACLHKVQTF
jgi:hypothetical protein